MKKLFWMTIMFLGVLIVVSCVTGTFHLVATMFLRFTLPLIEWFLNLLGMPHLAEVYRYIVEVGV